MANITAQLTLDNSQFRRALDASRSAAMQFGASLKALPVVGTVLSVAGLGALAVKALETGNRIADMARLFNLGTDSIQRLDVVASQSGVSLDTLAKAMRELVLQQQRALRDPTGAEAKAFENLGISVAELKRLNPEQLFLRFADGVAATTHEGERLELVTALIGNRIAHEIIPIAMQGGEALRNAFASASVASEDAVARLNELHQQFAVVKQFLSAFGMELAVALPEGFKLAFDVVRWNVALLKGDMEEARALMETFEERRQRSVLGEATQLRAQIQQMRSLLEQRGIAVPEFGGVGTVLDDIRLIRDYAAQLKTLLAQTEVPPDLTLKIEKLRDALREMSLTPADKVLELQLLERELMTQQADAQRVGNARRVAEIEAQILDTRHKLLAATRAEAAQQQGIARLHEQLADLRRRREQGGGDTEAELARAEEQLAELRRFAEDGLKEGETPEQRAEAILQQEILVEQLRARNDAERAARAAELQQIHQQIADIDRQMFLDALPAEERIAALRREELELIARRAQAVEQGNELGVAQLDLELARLRQQIAGEERAFGRREIERPNVDRFARLGLFAQLQTPFDAQRAAAQKAEQQRDRANNLLARIEQHFQNGLQLRGAIEAVAA